MEYQIELNRNFIAYSDLWHTANVLLNHSSEIEKGRTHIIRAALVFRAFAFESFLLHIGDRFFRGDNKYLFLSVKDKLKFISDRYSFDIDFGKRPFQTINILFDKRSKLAHSKDENLIKTYATMFDNSAEKIYERKLKTDIENYCKIENAIKAKEDSEKCIEIIADQIGMDRNELFRMGMEHGSMSVIQ